MKRLVFLLALLSISSPLFAAAPAWTGDGADALASTVLNWDTGVAPTTGDTVTFPGSGGGNPNKNCTWDICAQINILDLQSGYSGNWTASLQTQVNSGATQKITVNNTGVFDMGNQTVRAGTGGFDASGAATKTIVFGNSSSVLISQGNVNLSGANLTFTKGTGEISITSAATLTTNAKILHALTISAATTFADDVTITGTYSGAGAVSGGKNLFAQGDFSANSASADALTVNFTGSANQEWIGGGGNNYNHDTIINKSGGILTISGTLYVGFINKPVTITYTAGSISHTGTLGLRGTGSSVTLNTNGMVWNNVSFGSFESPTITLSSLLTVNGTITTVSNTILSGTGGISTANLTINSAKSLSAGGNAVTVSGNWTNNGTFIADTSTVVFNGTSAVDGSTAFYSLTCSGTCNFDDLDTFSTNASGVLSGDGAFQSDDGVNSADLNVNGSETVVTGSCTRLANAGTTVVTAGALTSCTGWAGPSVMRRMVVI